VSSPAQSGNTYKVRLAPAPRLVMTGLTAGQASRNVAADVIVGSIGSASAVLNGRKLTVTGSFEKLTSKPTGAHWFLGPATGVRDQGKPVFDLAISKTQSVPAPAAEPAAARGGRGGQQAQQAQQPAEARMWYSGAITGTVELTSAQVDALKKGRFYV